MSITTKSVADVILERNQHAPHPHAHRGQASLERAVKDASEDRISSKHKYKQRGMYYGAPGTISSQALWDNRFRGFLQNTLKVKYVIDKKTPARFGTDKPRSVDSCPTVEHIQRFLYEFPKHIKKLLPYGTLNYKTLMHGFERVVQSIQTRFPEFQFSRGHKQHIQAILHELLTSGVLYIYSIA